MATIQCHNCGELGHLARDCPNKSKQFRKDRASNQPQREQRTGRSYRKNDRSPGEKKPLDRRTQRAKAKKAYNNILAEIGESSDEEAASPQVNNTTVEGGNAVQSDSESSSEDEFSVNAARAMWNASKE